MRRPCSIGWPFLAAGRWPLLAAMAMTLAGCATLINPEAGRLPVALPPAAVVTELGTGDTVPVRTDDEGTYVDLPLRRVLALRVVYDSTAQYRILYPSSTPLSYLNVLSPALLGFFVDQVTGRDQAAWADTLRLRPGVPEYTPEEIAERDRALQRIARPDYVHSMFDRSRTHPMLLVGVGGSVTGPTTEAVLGGLNAVQVTLGVVLAPWVTVMYEHTAISYLRVGERRSTDVSVQSAGLRFQEPEFGFAVSGHYGRAATVGTPSSGDAGGRVEAPASYYAIGIGITGQWGALEYRRMVLMSRVPDIVPFTSWHSSICLTTHGLF